MVSPMDNFVALSSKHNVFDSNIISKFRTDDSMIKTLEELCKIIDYTMRPNIEYLGYEVIDQRKEFPSEFVQLHDSNIYCVAYKFKVSGTNKLGEKETFYKNMVIEIPNLINGEYYYINDTRYYPVVQLLDSTTFHRNNSLTLKCLGLPVVLTRVPTTIVDVNSKQYNSFVMYTDIQKKHVNFLTFFFGCMGFFRTLKFFEGNGTVFTIVSSDKVNKTDPNFKFFYISENIFLKVPTVMLENSVDCRTLVGCILDACGKNITLNELCNADWWKYEKLGTNFAKQKASKNKKVDLFLESFKRQYDSITRENVKNFEEVDKKDIYEVLRWMFINFTKLMYRDNTSIYNKRIRLSEYQIAPIVRRIMTKMHRVTHSRDRFKTPQKFEEVLTLPYKFSMDAKNKKHIEQSSDILIKSIINSNNTKYADSVNDMNLFNIALKWTLNAPSTTTRKTARSNSLSLSQRAQSPTMIGNISLNTSGAGDPGATGCFTPFAQVYNGFFKKPSNYTED